MDWTPLAAARPCGALRALFMIAAIGMALAAPTSAAPGETPIACQTTADLQRIAREADPEATIVLYRAGEARAFAAVVVALFGAPPPPLDLATTTIVGTYASSDPAAPIVVRFFDRDGCDFFGAATNGETLHEILGHMGS